MKIKATLIVLTVVLLQSCTLTRSLLYWGPDITDHKIFPYTEVLPGDTMYQFKKSEDKSVENYIVRAKNWEPSDTVDLPLTDFLEQKTGTVSFLVIRNDSILYEQYFRGYNRSAISTIFSVSKSVTSLLTGIAIDEGYIESIHDPVTKYIPELAKKDPNFSKLTIEHLLNMRAGFKFDEDSYLPWSKAAKIYYGTNLLGKIKRMKFEHEPGEVKSYQSITTALLGVVLERAIGRNLGEYLEEKIWVPLGMENRATWSMDDKRHRTAKAFCGLNTSAIDLAKIGRLYLNNGSWGGKQIVNSEWVTQSTTPNTQNYGYQYQWYSFGIWLTNPNSDSELFADTTSAREVMKKMSYRYPYTNMWESERSKGEWGITAYAKQYYALGIIHQTLFVDPEQNIIVVRLGEHSEMDYPNFIYNLIKSISQ